MIYLKPSHILLYLFLLVGGIITAFLIWLIVIMPLQIVHPIEFRPLEIDEKAMESASTKIEDFLSDDKTLVLSLEEAAGILKKSIERDLGLTVTDVYLDLHGDNKATAIFKIEIKDIPRSNLLTILFRLRNVEYTTTLISASLKALNGGIGYTINDFRIGGFKIPDIIVKKLFREGQRQFDKINIINVRFENNSIIIERG